MKYKENTIHKTISVEKIEANKWIHFIISMLFSISTAFLTFFLIPEYIEKNIASYLLAACSFLAVEVLCLEYHFVTKTLGKTKIIELLFALAMSIGFIVCLNHSLLNKTHIVQMYIIGAIALPACTLYLQWFYQKVRFYLLQYKQSLDTIEKRYLQIGTILITLFVASAYNLTTVFYQPQTPMENYQTIVTKDDEKDTPDTELAIAVMTIKMYQNWNDDILYTSDTGTLVREDTYVGVNASPNDIRQPLFGVFAMPFHILPKLLARLLPQIPNLYPILIAILQGIALLIAFTLLARLMHLKGEGKIAFLLCLTCTYPTLLFILNLEQYILSVCYIILFIYMVIQKLPDTKLAYIAMTGSMLTSGILFPLLATKKEWKKSIQTIFTTFVQCMVILLISGRILYMIPPMLQDQLAMLQKFSTNQSYSMQEKAAMYTNFLKNTLLFDTFEVDEQHIAAGKTMNFEFEEQNIGLQIITKAIRQAHTTNWSILGLGIGMAAILGFVFNRKDRFTKICFSWICFSLVLLYFLGWGTAENGLILYTLYFSWAFVCLLFKLAHSLLHKHPNLKKAAYVTAFLPMLAINLYGIVQVIQFGMYYYPG